MRSRRPSASRSGNAEARLQAEEEARRLAAEVELKRRQLLEQHLAVQAERVRRQRCEYGQ
jgi:hypothetical protein